MACKITLDFRIGNDTSAMGVWNELTKQTTKLTRDSSLLLDLLRQVLQAAPLDEVQVTSEEYWRTLFDDPDVDQLLLQGTPAAVLKGLTPYATLTVLDRSLPAKELGGFWSEQIPGPKTSQGSTITFDPARVNDDDYWQEIEEQAERAENSRDKKPTRSRKNPRTITLETEVLGRLALEVCLQGVYIGEAGFYHRVIGLWQERASSFGLDPRKYFRAEGPGKKDSTATVRSTLYTLERNLVDDGLPSPFRRPK